MSESSADQLGDFLEDYGCQRTGVELLERPVSSTNVVLYAQADTKPARPRDEWLSDPFDLVTKGDQLFGLGVSDSKFQLLNALTVAAEFDVFLLVDMMEESGGRDARQRIQELDPEWLVVVDGSADNIGVCYDAMMGQMDGRVLLSTGATPSHPARASRPGISAEIQRLLGELGSLPARATITGLECATTERSLSIEEVWVRLDVRFEGCASSDVRDFITRWQVELRQLMEPLISASAPPEPRYAPFSGWLGGEPLSSKVVVVPGGLPGNGNHRPNEWIYAWQPERHLAVLRDQLQRLGSE